MENATRETRRVVTRHSENSATNTTLKADYRSPPAKWRRRGITDLARLHLAPLQFVSPCLPRPHPAEPKMAGAGDSPISMGPHELRSPWHRRSTIGRSAHTEQGHAMGYGRAVGSGHGGVEGVGRPGARTLHAGGVEACDRKVMGCGARRAATEQVRTTQVTRLGPQSLVSPRRVERAHRQAWGAAR